MTSAPSEATQRVIDLCTKMSEGDTLARTALDAALQERRQALAAAWERFAREAESNPSDADRPLVNGVESQFLAYSRTLDRLKSALQHGDCGALRSQAANLADVSSQLVEAQIRYETSMFARGPSRFPTVNFFENLALRIIDGRIPAQRWQAECRMQRTMFQKALAEIDASPLAEEPATLQRRAACVRLLEVFTELEATSPTAVETSDTTNVLVTALTSTSSDDVHSILERMTAAFLELDEALHAFNVQTVDAGPTGFPEANRVIFAIRAVQSGSLTPDVLQGVAREMEEAVRAIRAEVEVASRLPAESPDVAAALPHLTEALDAASLALQQLTAGRPQLDGVAERLQAAVEEFVGAYAEISSSIQALATVVCPRCEAPNSTEAQVCVRCERPLPRYDKGIAATSGVVTSAMRELVDVCAAVEEKRASVEQLRTVIERYDKMMGEAQRRIGAMTLPEIPPTATDEERDQAQTILDVGGDCLGLAAQGVRQCLDGLASLIHYADGHELSDMRKGLNRFNEGCQTLLAMQRVAQSVVPTAAGADDTVHRERAPTTGPPDDEDERSFGTA